MSTKQKLNELFIKLSDSYTITNCRNGFVIEFSGEDSKSDWVTAKYILNTTDELTNFIREILSIPTA